MLTIIKYLRYGFIPSALHIYLQNNFTLLSIHLEGLFGLAREFRDSAPDQSQK